MTEIIDLETIGQSDVAKVLNAWRKGMVVAYPTDTIYGLGVDAFNRKAVQSLLRLKRRKGG
ncbi:MAG: Sua5/YciO/YrdC/YwlC family protein, partial [Candidatus Marinimicrobia bacterium]|nr:Sua5/YciO/YrdC/YwlC family protein [Candidatus Neomarinimicrobiota bacterium]